MQLSVIIFITFVTYSQCFKNYRPNVITIFLVYNMYYIKYIFVMFGPFKLFLLCICRPSYIGIRFWNSIHGVEYKSPLPIFILIL